VPVVDGVVLGGVVNVGHLCACVRLGCACVGGGGGGRKVSVGPRMGDALAGRTVVTLEMSNWFFFSL
jgi:hypothetical protein